MKKYIFIVSLLCLLAACTGKRQGEAAVEVAALPAVEDVVMYQVNPRVFAPEKSFKAVERRLDSIQALGINVVWFMPINEVGAGEISEFPLLCEGLQRSESGVRYTG